MISLSVSRRTLLAAAAAAGFVMTPLAKAVAAAVDDYGTYRWCACVINCGQRCPLRCYTKNGQVIRSKRITPSPTRSGPVRSAPASAAVPCGSAFIRPIV